MRGPTGGGNGEAHDGEAQGSEAQGSEAQGSEAQGSEAQGGEAHDGEAQGGGAGTAGQQPSLGSETARERVNRQWQEILQETRVAQTGVQVLFGFLLSVAFTGRFAGLATLDRTIYVVTVILAAGATGALIAPVSIHRFLSGQRMKDEVVDAAGRLMMCGMVLLALTVGSTLLLILHVVLSNVVAEILVGAVMVWFVCCWYVVPALLRSRSTSRNHRRQGASRAESARPDDE